MAFVFRKLKRLGDGFIIVEMLRIMIPIIYKICYFFWICSYLLSNLTQETVYNQSKYGFYFRL